MIKGMSALLVKHPSPCFRKHRLLFCGKHTVRDLAVLVPWLFPPTPHPPVCVCTHAHSAQAQALVEDSEGNPMSCLINFLFPSGRATSNLKPALLAEQFGQWRFACLSLALGLQAWLTFFFFFNMGARDLNAGPYSLTETCSYPPSQSLLLIFSLFTSPIPYQEIRHEPHTWPIGKSVLLATGTVR